MNRPTARSRRDHGFTLVELVASSALLTVMLLAGAATASLVRRAAFGSAASNAPLGANALTELRRDLTAAVSVITADAKTAVFVVPDRDGDGLSETISYAWSGVRGAPLLRRLDDGAWTTVVPSVNRFAMTWNSLNKQVAVSKAPPAEPEVLMASCTTTSDLRNVSVKNNASFSQSFVPSGVGAGRTWTLTRVRINVRDKGSASGSFAVQVRPTNGGLPTNQVLSEVGYSESTLGSSYTWLTVPFGNVSGLNATAPVAIVIRWIADTDACEFQATGSGSAIVATSTHAKSTDGCVTWAADSSQSILYEVYGRLDPTARGTTTATALDDMTDGLGETRSAFVPLRAQPTFSGALEVQ